MRRGYPRWAYELLPYAYIGAGLFIIALLRDWLASFSSMILIAAGVAVICKRRKHRERRRNLLDSFYKKSIQNDAEAEVTYSFAPLIWQPSFLVGHPIIDQQHQALFASCNNLITALKTDRPEIVVIPMVDKLLNEILQHFAKETGVIAHLEYPGLDEYKKLHDALMSRAMEYRDNYRMGKLTLIDLAGFIVGEVIVKHVRDNHELHFPKV